MLATAPPSSPADPSVRLTSYTAAAGCGCKLAAADLLPIVGGLQSGGDDRLIVGAATSDDAAVIELREDLLLVQTVDFFTPLVDDPYDFGRIAAANALSDVYAMGATPIAALNIVAFPLDDLGGAVLREILRGGGDVVRAAGAMLVGGHSIRDVEPKYGLAVSGIVEPAHMTVNAAGRAGDVLVLTKPLGVGAVVTAHKRGHADDDLLRSAVDVMITLNADAAAEAVRAGVRAMTDVTGFGLLGHLHHLCRESGLAAVVEADRVPALSGVEELLEHEEAVSGGSRRNAAWTAEFTTIDAAVSRWRTRLLADATTSGGLLIAVDPEQAEQIHGVAIGGLRAGPVGTIAVR